MPRVNTNLILPFLYLRAKKTSFSGTLYRDRVCLSSSCVICVFCSFSIITGAQSTIIIIYLFMNSNQPKITWVQYISQNCFIRLLVHLNSHFLHISSSEIYFTSFSEFNFIIKFYESNYRISQNNGITCTLRNFIDPHQNCYFHYSLNVRYTKNTQQHFFSLFSLLTGS